MYRSAQMTELEDIIELVYIKNNNPITSSSYMSKSKQNIKSDIYDTFSTNHQHIWICEENKKIEAVIIGFYQDEQKVMDVAGPYHCNDDVAIGEKLLNNWIKNFDQSIQYNFFFDAKSDYFTQIMGLINAKMNQKEFILTLNLNQVTLSPNRLDVNFMGKNQIDKVKIAFEEIFPNIYVSKEEIVLNKEHQRVIILEHQNDIAGLAYIKIFPNLCSLECFGLRSLYRGQKLSVPFLNAVIHKIKDHFDIHTVRLVVDETNDMALNIYEKVGFDLEQINLSYQLIQKK